MEYIYIGWKSTWFLIQDRYSHVTIREQEKVNQIFKIRFTTAVKPVTGIKSAGYQPPMDESARYNLLIAAKLFTSVVPHV